MFYIACSKCGKQTVRQLWYGGGSTKNQELIITRGTFKKSAASSACNADRRQLTAAPKYKIQTSSWKSKVRKPPRDCPAQGG